MKLRVGLIGLGDAWQKRHAPAYARWPIVSRSAPFASRCGIGPSRPPTSSAPRPSTAIGRLTRREDIDAVLMLSPQWYGALPILAACEAGKAVYCAAGLDLDAEEAQAIKRRVERGGHRLRGRVSPPPGAGHVPFEGVDRHAAGPAPTAVLPPALARPTDASQPPGGQPHHDGPSARPGRTGRLVPLRGRPGTELA